MNYCTDSAVLQLLDWAHTVVAAYGYTMAAAGAMAIAMLIVMLCTETRTNKNG